MVRVSGEELVLQMNNAPKSNNIKDLPTPSVHTSLLVSSRPHPNSLLYSVHL